MTSGEFQKVREYLGMNNREFSDALGLHRGTSRGYALGAVPIPLTVELACWALVMRPRVARLVPDVVDW